MNVITMESEVWETLLFRLNRMAQQIEEMGNKEPDRIMSIDQAAEYLGVDRKWVSTRKKAFGYFIEGRIIRIRKSAIDAYINKHTIIKK